jgi:N-acyl-D-glutamate deacylase
MSFDIVIKHGLFLDGTGAPGVVRNLGIRGGRLVAISDAPLDEGHATEVIDAHGQWVMPGFVDIHTHYDAELLAAPALSESIRHGVTTVTVGSCSISTILAEPEDCSDLFTRVESIPREQVLPLLLERKRWNTPRGYVDFLASHPLGPNVTAFLGHSDLRARVMGLSRSIDRAVRPTEAELREMERWLGEALDCGLLGLSTMTNPWDKLDGHRHRSAQLPSTYATWREYRRLGRVLRKRGRVLQSAPSAVNKINFLLFLLASASLHLRRALRTTLITLADAKSMPGLHRVIATLTRLCNVLLGSDLRWQTLPMPFELYSDGIDLPVFEEFGAGAAALHLTSELERRRLFSDPGYRTWFRRTYEQKWTPRVWHRDLHDAFIVACPDASVVGRSFGAVADERGLHPVDTFLDLLVVHGKQLRWRMTVANHREDEVARMMGEPSALIGFADSGAHIRNMAFYCFPLRMLKLVRDRERAGQKVMTLERAVWRLTGELGQWLGVAAGTLRAGDRADVVVIDPEALDQRLLEYHEAEMEGFGLSRMVNRSEGAVRAVLVNGRMAFREGALAGGLGRAPGFGQFLPANG